MRIVPLEQKVPILRLGEAPSASVQPKNPELRKVTPTMVSKQSKKKKVEAPAPDRNPEADIFVVLSYEILRGDGKGGQYPFLHAVWSGFNTAFKRVFEGTNPVDYMQMLAAEKLIELRPFKGGVTIKPLPPMLKKLSPDEQAISARLRVYLNDFHDEWAEEKKRRAAAKEAAKLALPPKPEAPKPTAAETAAGKLWAKGDTAKALDKLGY